MKRMIIWISTGLVALVLLVAGCQVTRAGYESAAYRVMRTDGDFELRDYPALTVVETTTAGTGDDGSFMRLFRFISGANEGSQKIAMTTPVFMHSDATNSTMSFVMPATMSTTNVPKPTDSTVNIRELEAGRFAVLRYSGARSETNATTALKQLETWMDAQKLRVLSAPVHGYFDPPWTPGFMRRNEVMLRTEPQS